MLEDWQLILCYFTQTLCLNALYFHVQRPPPDRVQGLVPQTIGPSLMSTSYVPASLARLTYSPLTPSPWPSERVQMSPEGEKGETRRRGEGGGEGEGRDSKLRCALHKNGSQTRATNGAISFQRG